MTKISTANMGWFGIFRRPVFLLPVMAALMAIALGARLAHGDVSGTSKGHGLTVQGSIIGQSLSLNNVTLPPGGNAGANLSASAGTASLTADTATVNCSGSSSGASVTATCSSLVEGLNFSAEGQQIVGATLLRAQSNSADSGGGASSNDGGTEIVGLCVVQVLLGPCNPVTGPATVNVNIAGIASGSVIVKQEASRSSDSGVSGSGLTVTMLHIDLTVTGQGAVVLDIARADSFVGGVAVSNPTPPPGSGDPGTPPSTQPGDPGTPPSTQPGDGTSVTGFPQNLPNTGGPPSTEADGINWALAGLILLTSGASIIISARKAA